MVVGAFSTSDPDDGDGTTSVTGSGAHVLSFTGGDAMYFTVDGTNIKFNAGVLNELTKSSYTTTLRLVDGPHTIDRTVTVDVLSLQEQINNAASGSTLTVIPGEYSSISVTGPKTLTINGGRDNSQCVAGFDRR